ncbi:hypothetical protein B0A48_03640 [Cryoendolithus antarcticus]|uniref:Protein kinase domain-containing protein n=1 Tax=Cryoendolithus antarcticus TaxID=1507870 RepID=A0A1V8TKK5_9PEZI|nr:hypothetical protein B0A48_03640 [Cryoendolithus antarcticus]
MQADPIVIDTSSDDGNPGVNEPQHIDPEGPDGHPSPTDGNESDDDWPDMEHDTDELQPAHSLQVKRAALRRAAFMESSWHNGNELGAGGFGTVFVAYKVDQNLVMRDLVAVKDVYMKRHHCLQWTYWDGDVRDLENRVPIETAIMTALADEAGPGAEKTVFLRCSCPFNLTHSTYRLYMEYCWGSLSDAIGQRVHEMELDPNDLESSQFPEFLLWKWLEDLTEACIVMAEGSLDETAPPKNWRPIVQRDIKPGNILVDAPIPGGDWPDVSTLRLTEFGGSIFTDANDPHNPMSYNFGPGTTGWQPPELTSEAHRLGLTAKGRGKLGPHTNVFQIGAALIAAANYNLAKTGDDFQPRVDQALLDDHNYSQALAKLLHRCVRRDPEKRIKLRELRQRIREHTGEGPEGMRDRGRGARRAATLPENMQVRLSWSVDKTYREGLTPPAEADEALLEQYGL